MQIERTNLFLTLLILSQVITIGFSIDISSSKSQVLTTPDNSQTGFTSISYYVQGHQDDWELFYGQQLWEDLNGSGNENRKIVFIYTTAGDAGSRSNGWWNYRENGAIAAVQAASPCTPVSSTIFANTHQIAKVTCGRTESYFMRLPDGSPPGFGYYDTGFASLKKLYEGIVGPVRTVDEESKYEDWSDFKETIKEILKLSRPESIGDNIPIINVADFEALYPHPTDHTDHHYTSIAIDEIVKEGGKFNRALYQTYCLVNLEKNLTDIQIAHKKQIFDGYSKAAASSDHYSIDVTKQEWRDWGEKNNHRFLNV